MIAAGDRGIYAGVMLFEGWAIHLSPAPFHVEGHPFHAANNVNGVGIGSILDYQVLPLEPRVQALQEAYVHRVVDTLHDLPTVLWEVANESSGGGAVEPDFAQALGLPADAEWGDSTQWQYWVIDVVRKHEADHGYETHPIGMTMQFPVPSQTKVNEPLLAGGADWISPGFDDEVFAEGGHPMAPGSPQSRWLENPPMADGRKVVVSDTDHYAPGRGDALWAWTSFVRGHHPILMDFGLLFGVNPPDPSAGGPMSFEAFEPARRGMGDTARFAERMDLIRMEPRVDVSSTGYALANPGTEVLVLAPRGGPFTVRLEPGTYAVEWFGVEGRETVTAGPVALDEVALERGGDVAFDAPAEIAGPAVLYLRVA